jgi:hypothetical protein
MPSPTRGRGQTRLAPLTRSQLILLSGCPTTSTCNLRGPCAPRNDLLRGRINKFSLDALINVAAAAGLAVRVEVVNAA